MKSAREQNAASLVRVVQGVYYIITAIWSIVGIKSFQKVTGPKMDLWLVKTVGVIVLVIGTVLTTAGLRRVHEPEIATLAIGNALALSTVNTYYSLRGRISRIYLLDTLAELALVGLWLGLRRKDVHK